jgi:S1-C subfamily serine protease
MKTHLWWGFTTLVLVTGSAALTWVAGGRDDRVPVPSAAVAPAPTTESVKLLVAFSQPLAKVITQSRTDGQPRILDSSTLRTSTGKRIEIELVPMTSQEMVEGTLNGSLKAHILVPASDIYLNLADREWMLRTGKPLMGDRTTFMRQPYVLAVRRPMAEAMGWPGKEIGWAEVAEIARGGWKAVGHAEWGPLKLLIVNPEFSDEGLHSAVSLVHGVLGKSKGLTSRDLENPTFTGALRSVDNAVVWYPSSFDDLLRNETLDVPHQCHMTFLSEHLLVALNDRYARRGLPPAWVAIYPKGATVVDGVTAGVVQREWVTDEQREAAGVVLSLLRTIDTQKRIVELGYRPVVSEVALVPPITKAMGLDPNQPGETIEMPPVEIVLDCLAAWEAVWRLRVKEVSGSAPMLTPAPVAKGAVTSLVGVAKLSHLTPTVQCVHRARPSTVFIKREVGKMVYGTGVVVDQRGYVITNHHVVRDSKEVSVHFVDSPDKVHKGEAVWEDPIQDMAVVRILTPGKYPVIKFADSDRVEVGEMVVAIGNPFGYTGTVTLGVVSALDREITLPSGGTLKKLIQTDASINPGSSGGPLLNIDGELIGIIVALRQEARGIAFAIPSNRVREYVGKNLPK